MSDKKRDNLGRGFSEAVVTRMFEEQNQHLLTEEDPRPKATKERQSHEQRRSD